VPPAEAVLPVPLTTIAREWLWIGCIGYGGPPAHIALLRRLCVRRRGWLSDRELEDGIAAVTLLPGPASTQLAIFCAWRLRGAVGGLLGGACFILPGLALMLTLSALLIDTRIPVWLAGAAAGAGAAVPAVALQAAAGLLPASWRAAGPGAPRVRWICYLTAGALAAAPAVLGPYLVLVLVAAGALEAALATRRPPAALAALPFPTLAAGGLLAAAGVAFKVGALSFGGGFVIIPLIQHDAWWMSSTQFLDAVAIGQITPGPVVLTVAFVGYAAAGLAGALLATLVAFTPSFLFVLAGAPHFDRLRRSPLARAFLRGAGPAAIGAIAGAAVPLALDISHPWQWLILALAAAWLLLLRRSVVTALLGAAALGSVAALLT
jgi:chromate transporter